MDKISTQQASTALELLADVAARRQAEFQSFDALPSRPDSDDETESDSPIFDSFFNSGGNAAIHQMTNFTSNEFMRLWIHLSAEITSKYNVGRGRRSTFAPQDILFMTLTTLKHSGKWDFLGRMFGVKGPTMERTVTNFVTMLNDKVYHTFVVDVSTRHPMKRIIDQKRTFKTYPFAGYATDVTFQQTNRPTGNLQESKKYFSGKHKLYGYKIEVSVLPNGLAIGCTDHFPGSVSDVDILYRNIYFHKWALKKKEDEKGIADIGQLADKYPELWAVLLDKGYQGSGEFFRAVHGKKKPRNGFLTYEEEQNNKKISSDRIIVENVFGRLCLLWGVLSEKYRWAKSFYDALFHFCIGLTNVHITLHPLRHEDYEFFQRFKNRQYTIGDEVLSKRKKKQEKYRSKRRRRMNAHFREWEGSFKETIEP